MPTLRARPPPPPPAPSSSRPPPPPPVLFDPVPPPTEPVLALRREWKFAAVCQFVFTFEEALQLGGEFETEEFEDDLTLGSHKIVNKLMSKMLVILTYDRRITEDDWERSLRHQYERRAPEILLLGTEEEPVTWAELKPLQRVDAIHAVSEWLMLNPNNLRRKMKDEESAYLWRIEPIGYDAKKNAYWLFDDNRLWVQRAPPKPKVSHKKKERPPPAQPPQKKQKLSAAQAKGKTQTLVKPATPAPKPKAAQPQPEEEVKSNGRYPRRAAASKPPPPSPSKTPPKPRVMGIRQSSRLRGKEEDQAGWQEIPEEWLTEGGALKEDGKPDEKMEEDGEGKGKMVNGNGTGRKRPLEEEGDSDLTDLSDEEEGEKPKELEVEKPEEPAEDVEMKDAAEEEMGKVKLEQEQEQDPTAPSSSLSSPPVTPPPPPRTINGILVPDDFVEWETIAVTLYQWEHVAERFEKATHRDERALWAVLVEDVVPRVLRELREIEKLRKKEELMATRKRSSRLQMKELELEQKRLEEEKKVEEEVANARNRRAEEREKRQEMERVERERKAKEREERALRREAWVPGMGGSATPGAGGGGEGETGDSSTVVEEAGSQKGRKRTGKQRKGEDGEEEEEEDGLRGPGEEKWELDCEVCGKKGWNVDDGKKMACCEQCGKWQHTACHDAADLKAGRQKRRWAQVTFKCKECRNKHRRELYAKRQEATRLKQEEERAKMIAAGLPVDGLPALPGSGGLPQANGELKIHLSLPKIPTSVSKQQLPPTTNGVPQPGGTPGSSRPSAQGSANRVRTSPKVPLVNGHSAPFTHSSSPTYSVPPMPTLDKRISGSHSPSIPTQPYIGFNPAAGPTYANPQHRPSYPAQFNAYSPSMGYPQSNTGASAPHTPQTQPHPPHPASHPAAAPPSSSSSPHQPRSPQAPVQHSPNPQQPGQPGYQYGYPAAYGTPGYAYGFSHGRPSPQQQQQQQQQYYQYYQTYGAAAAAGDPRYAAHGASYPPPAGKQAHSAPLAGRAPGTNGAAPVQGLMHSSPGGKGQSPSTSDAVDKLAIARPPPGEAARLPEVPIPILPPLSLTGASSGPSPHPSAPVPAPAQTEATQ